MPTRENLREIATAARVVAERFRDLRSEIEATDAAAASLTATAGVPVIGTRRPITETGSITTTDAPRLGSATKGSGGRDSQGEGAENAPATKGSGSGGGGGSSRITPTVTLPRGLPIGAMGDAVATAVGGAVGPGIDALAKAAALGPQRVTPDGQVIVDALQRLEVLMRTSGDDLARRARGEL